MASLVSILQQAGFSGQGLQMAIAIAMAESGGNARSFNGNASTGDQSYGLFQINMLGAMGPERRAQYGLSSNDDLFDPLTNAKIAFKMSNGGTSWGPWSTYGNGAYRKYLGSSGGADVGSSSSTSNATTSGGQPVAAQLDAATLAEQYGFTSAFLNANPELKKVFQKAVSGQWSSDKFKASLMTTNWWKTHSDSERQYLTQTFTDPATARQAYSQAQVHAAQMLDQIGVGQNNKNYNSLLGTITYNIAAKGWNDQQIKYFAGQYANLLNGRMTGDAETNYSNGLQYAYSMGVKMSDSWYQNQIQGIERGTNTFADLQQGIRDQAKAQFSQFSKQIDAGQTMQDLASPYISQMGQILEINPQGLSAFDPTIKKALTYKDPATGAVGSQPLWQFENTLRQDPRWLQTNNARDTMMTTAHGVLQSFGFVS